MECGGNVGSVEYIQPGECSRARRGELRNARSFASSPHELVWSRRRLPDNDDDRPAQGEPSCIKQSRTCLCLN
jgi:hypothetical protein